MFQPSFDLGDEVVDDQGNPTFTVGELVEAINAALTWRFNDGVWVRGEIDGLRHSGPHTYFSLVDDDQDHRSVIPVQLFAPVKRRLTPMLKKNRLSLDNGLKVRIYGHPDYYGPSGRLGLKMAGLDPTFTLGQLSQQRDQVIRRLVAAGLYDANRTRRVAAVPLRVGVVTSVGTAAWHDFHDELTRSGLGFRLMVADVRVQGPTAIDLVSAAIGTLARRDVDLIVVIRGGGARSELAVFDAEPITLAIATSRRPVFTGLGHETDRSIADEVAHTALKTPTAVARHLIDLVDIYRDATEQCFAAIVHLVDGELDRGTARVDRLAVPIVRGTRAAVERADERLGHRVVRTVAAAESVVTAGRRQLESHARRVVTGGPRPVQDASRSVDVCAARLAGVDPERLMRRGWSITRNADTGAVVRSVNELDAGTAITTEVGDGVVSSTVSASVPRPERTPND